MHLKKHKIVSLESNNQNLLWIILLCQPVNTDRKRLAVW
jgi:hypothetical protein